MPARVASGEAHDDGVDAEQDCCTDEATEQRVVPGLSRCATGAAQGAEAPPARSAEGAASAEGRCYGVVLTAVRSPICEVEFS